MSQEAAKAACREGRVHLQRGGPFGGVQEGEGAVRRGAMGATLVRPGRDVVWREGKGGGTVAVAWRPPQVSGVHATHYTLYAACRNTRYALQHTLHTAHNTVHGTRRNTRYTVQRTVHTTRYTLQHTLHATLHAIHYTTRYTLYYTHFTLARVAKGPALCQPTNQSPHAV
eukprot:793792-Pyramimonas_sp.AAC.1